MNGKSMFTAAPMTERHCQAICEWRYEPPYDLYNWSSWESLKQAGEEFADPKIRTDQFCSIVNEDGELCAFAQFFPLDGIIRLGVGLRPDLCGQGFGVHFMEAIVKEAKKRAPSHIIDLEVLTWNDRAYKVYERSGFVYEQTYDRMTPTGMAAFHCMVYKSK